MSPSRNGRMLSLFLISFMLASSVAVVLSLGANAAIGGEAQEASESFAPTAAQTKALLESGTSRALTEATETNLKAAQSMPHSDLDRGEALALAEAVFEPEIEAATGIYGDLEPEKILSKTAAVVPISSLPEVPGQTEEGLSAEHPNVPILVESTLPLGNENASGEEEAVDLSLEHSDGELQPQNPLTEVGIPEEVGEGISLPGPEIAITIANAPEDRVATNVGGDFAFFPEVADDSDLIVSPAAEGVETMMDVRSPEAPTETTYDLSLPAGAELKATDEGGAEVIERGRTTLLIPPPIATDAAGDPVKTDLTVGHESITVGITPSPSMAFPALVDPIFITEGWRWTLNHDSLNSWYSSTTNRNAMNAMPYEVWAPEYQYPGLDITSGYGGVAHSGDNANWEYWVPRYRRDVGSGLGPPSTWVYQMFTEGVLFLPYGNSNNYPALVLGLVDPTFGWEVAAVHYGGEGEMNNWGNKFKFTNEYEQPGDKGAVMNLVTYENAYPPRRDTYMADAYISVVDTDAPRILELHGLEKWVGGAWASVPYEFEDAGLGMERIAIGLPGETPLRWPEGFGCNGTTASVCPRDTKSTESGRPALAFVPNELPTGKDKLEVTASDALGAVGVAGHTTQSSVVVKVDHTGPEVSLAGSLTEQGSLGTHLPRYALRVNVRDGVAGAPQSGVKAVEVMVDGKKVWMPEEAEWEPNCVTENCPFNGEWSLNASEYAAGTHEVKVIATDAVGNGTTKVLQVELHPPSPSLLVSGTMTQQGTLGTERPSYKLNINASALAESPTPAGIPTYSSLFGSSGPGNGQFARPGSMAIDAQGNLWVADSNNNRVEKFNEKGEYLSQFGTEGSGNGQLNHPTAVAVAANGNLWVADSFNRRVEEFTSTGAYLAQFGSQGTGNGQFAGSGPEAVAIDYHGNIWVADTYGGRVEKFSENGTFIRSVATKGKGPEQLGQPDGVAVAPGGNVFVSDWEDDKVAEYGEGGKFIRRFGAEGSEPGQLRNPTGIAIDSRGDVWVPDQNNGRVEEFNQGGEYLGVFGAKGSGSGQFELSYPTGIATDTKGDIWITDAGNNRVQKWVSANYGSTLTPTYLGSFGSSGSTAGHFTGVLGLAADSKGNVWAADANNNFLQKFNSRLEALGTYGKSGAGSGELAGPTGLTANSGHIWDVEMFNARVQEFSESGAYLSKFGSPGSAPGLLEYPWGIAVDSGHHVWVTGLGANAVQEFSETGTFIRTLGKKGSGNGEFMGATGIAVGPGGKLWIADFGGNRVEEFTESGTFLRQFAGSEYEVGHLGEPMGIYVDGSERVWVVDRLHHRVVEFNGQGEYIGQFGTPGSGAGQFSLPEYVVGDQTGHLFVSDSANSNVEEWSVPAPHSQVSTEITIDGRRVEANEIGCAAGACSATKEWTLQSSSLTPGPHEVVVRATDGLGNTTSKTLNIKVGDATKPGLEAGGELVEAPEGWIEQAEGNYALHATATDSGYGVTSLVFSVDGKVVAEKAQTCAAGGCSASITTAVNARGLTAGAHPAELVATDGAGNATTKHWTINVDPEGHISVEAAEATIEALEETAAGGAAGAESILSSPGADTSPGIGPPAWESIPVTDTNVPTSISQEPAWGVEYEIADDSLLSKGCPAVSNGSYPGAGEAEESKLEEGRSASVLGCEPNPSEREKLEEEERVEEEEVAEGRKTIGRVPITITPLNVSVNSSAMTGVGGSATLAANVHNEADTVFRPMSAGGYTFETIRSTAAPEHYAYELNLYEQELVQASPSEVWVKYTDGGPVAFTIEALPVHDAIGTTVPSHIAVTGSNVITLSIEHRGPSPAGGSFVYPVVGGVGWEGGYRTISVVLAEPPPPPPEEPGQEGTVTDEGEFFRTRVTVVGPGVPDAYQRSQGSEPNNPAHWFAFSECIDGKTKAIMEEVVKGGVEGVRVPDATLVGNCAKLTPMKHTWRGNAVRGWFHVNSSGWVWINDPAHQMECPTWGMVEIAMVHCYVHPQRVHGELTVGGDFRTAVGSWFPNMADCLTVYGHLRPSPPYMVPQESIDTQRLKGEKCDWPAE